MKIVHRTNGIDRFAQIDNRTIRDQQISYRALGLYLFLASHADGYDLDLSRVGRSTSCTAGEGRDATLKAAAELEANGYIKREQRRHPETGRYFKICEVFDVPGTGFQGAVIQGQESQASKEDQLRNTKKNTKKNNHLQKKRTTEEPKLMKKVRKNGEES